MKILENTMFRNYVRNEISTQLRESIKNEKKNVAIYLKLMMM